MSSKDKTSILIIIIVVTLIAISLGNPNELFGDPTAYTSGATIIMKGSVIHAEQYDWVSALIAEYPHWCPAPPDQEYWYQGEQFTILFTDGQKISINIENGDGKITLEPEILMISQEVSQVFNDFELEQNDMLAIYLDRSGISFEVLFCGDSGDTLWLTWAKG